jgi:hypothetical protein
MLTISSVRLESKCSLFYYKIMIILFYSVSTSWKPEKVNSSLYLPQDKAEKKLARGLILSL